MRRSWHAAEYLAYSNNYLRTESYRVLFSRQVEGEHVGGYIGLDFAHLMALSRIEIQPELRFLERRSGFSEVQYSGLVSRACSVQIAISIKHRDVRMLLADMRVGEQLETTCKGYNWLHGNF